MKYCLLLFIVLLSACHTVKTSTVKKKSSTAKTPSAKSSRVATVTPAKSVIRYESAGNDLANINLNLREDHSFELVMKIIPETAEQKAEVSTLSGKWKQEGEKIVLTFSEKKLQLNQLFDNPPGASDEYEILDDQRISLNPKSSIIHIWGVICERKEK